MAGLADWFSSMFQPQGTSIPGDAGQAEAAAQQPSLTNWMQGNQQTLMGLGLGLMSGDSKADAYRNAMLGAQRGVVLDASAKKDKEAQDQRAKRQAAYQQLAQKGMIPPELANDPELAGQYLQQKWQQQFREPTLYDRMTPEQQKQYLQRQAEGEKSLIDRMTPEQQKMYLERQAKGDDGTPAGYRWSQTSPGQLEPIPGGPKDPASNNQITTDQRNKLAQGRQARQNLEGLATELDSLVQKNGSEIMPGATKQRMSTLMGALQMELKEMLNLGVLNGGDMDVIRGFLPDPTSVKEGFTPGTAGRFSAGVTALKQYLDNKLAALEGVPGPGYSGGEQTPALAGDVRGPRGGKSSGLNWSIN